MLSPFWGRTSRCPGRLKWQLLTFQARQQKDFHFPEACSRWAWPALVTWLGDLQERAAWKSGPRSPLAPGTMGPKCQFLNTGFALRPVQNPWVSGLDCVASSTSSHAESAVWCGEGAAARPAALLTLQTGSGSPAGPSGGHGLGEPLARLGAPHGEQLFLGAWVDTGPWRPWQLTGAPAATCEVRMSMAPARHTVPLLWGGGGPWSGGQCRPVRVGWKLRGETRVQAVGGWGASHHERCLCVRATQVHILAVQSACRPGSHFSRTVLTPKQR